jgi:hypothetical protein
MQYFFITSNGNLINYSQKMAVMPITFELLFNYIVHFFIQTTLISNVLQLEKICLLIKFEQFPLKFVIHVRLLFF